jgi:PAS domain S-box-containing protein
MNIQIKQRVGANFATVLSICLLLSFNLIGLKNELLFHFLIETITIILCSCLFAIVWLLREKIDNGYFTVLGIGLLFSSYFDMLHILTFEKMPIFPELNLNHSFYFFLAGRFLQAATLAIAPTFVGKRTKDNLVLLIYSLFSVLVSLAILHLDLPALISPTGNHTIVRNTIDFTVIIILVFALFLVYKKRPYFEKKVFLYFLGSTILAIISGIVISLNTNETHLISIVGLNLRLVAYFLIFQTLLVTGISKPQEVFYHGLQTNWEELQNLIDNLSEGICIIDQQGKFILSNPAADRIFGNNTSKVTDHNFSEFLSNKQQKINSNEKTKVKNTISNSYELEIDDFNHRKHTLMVFSSPRIIDGNPNGEFLIFHDISEHKSNQIKLEEAGKVYQTLFMDAPIRIWEMDYSKVKENIDQLQEEGITNLQIYFNQHMDIVKYLASLVKIKNYNKFVQKTYTAENPEKRIESLTEIFWEKSYPSFIQELIAIANHKNEINFEMTSKTLQGEIRYSIINWSAILSDSKDYSRVIISADDITDREKSRLELQSSEEKFRLLAKYSEVGISYFDLQGNVLFHNEKVMEQLGRKNENDIGKNIYSLYGEEIAERTISRIKKAARTDQTAIFVDSLKVEGKQKWFSTTYTRILDEQDQCTGIQIISHDVTQQKELESQLESLARFPRENPNPVMRLSKGGTVSYCNEGGLPILEVWDCNEGGQVPEAISAIIHNCLDSNNPELIEVNVGDRILSLHLSPSTEMDYVNIYGRDITDIKKAEKELLKYSKDLELIVEEKTDELLKAQDRLARQEKLAVMGQLASGVGHELRNPLAVINNAVYMLKLGSDQKSDTSDEYLDIIDQEVASANKIITDLLTFARIKPANLIPTDVRTSLEEIIKKFVPPENVRVEINLSKNLPLVNVDDKQIEQVMANLITNAYQAIPKSGQLTITDKVEKKMLRLDFTDTGIGIPPENMEKIFEPLFSTKSKGIGLGLTISKMLAEANGGKIKVKSTLDKGSTFSLYLPFE